MIASGALRPHATAAPALERAMMVEAGPTGRWSVTFVAARPAEGVERVEVDAAALRNPTARCIQRLGKRLLHDAGPASVIVFLLDKLASKEQLRPTLITSYPVPILGVAPSVTLAAAAPVHMTRFALLDLSGRGTLALVSRDADGRIGEYSPNDANLRRRVGLSDKAEIGSGDLLTDAMSQCHADDVEHVAASIFRDLASLLDAARSFGFGALVCASRRFADPVDGAAFLRAAAAARGPLDAVSLVEEGARWTALTAQLSDVGGEPGVWMSTQHNVKTLVVSAPRSVHYSVTHVARHIFDPSEPALARLVESRPTVFVIDKAVDAIYGQRLRGYAENYLDCVDIIPIVGDEAHKAWQQVEEICSRAIRAGLRRDGVIAAVGGGITLDITGLAASLYRRGVRFARIPTTLIGLVDVCVGIKQGINYGPKKNILGAFYPPFGGINDLTFLRTVDRRHLACGIAEIVKMALVRDPFLFELLEAHTTTLLQSHFQAPKKAAEQIAIRAELAMMSELQPNLFEHDLKRLVDFGHSFSPVLESASNYEVHHGEAVGIDVMISTAAAVRRGLCESSVMRRLGKLYADAGLPLSHALCTPRLLHEGLRDIVIHRGGNLNLVVPTGLGSATFVQEMSADEIALVLEDIALLAAELRAAVVPGVLEVSPVLEVSAMEVPSNVRAGR